MNKRKDEKLIQIAFGDLKAEALTPEEQVAVNKYEGFRSDLELLREVPPHQLSNERLRTAILGQGLKPGKETAKSDGSWFLAMGASAALIAMFVIGTRLHRSSASPVLDPSINSPLASNEKFDLSFPHGDQLEPNIDASSAYVKPSGFAPPKHAPVSHETLAVRKVAKRTHHKDLEKTDSSIDPNLYALVGPPDVDSDVASDQASHPVAAAASKAPANEPPLDKVSSSPDSKDIVEIGQDKDAETGARSAREVEGKNVAFGG